MATERKSERKVRRARAIVVSGGVSSASTTSPSSSSSVSSSSASSSASSAASASSQEQSAPSRILRILVMGRAGNGKSSTCNSLFGGPTPIFESDVSPTGVTQAVQWHRATPEGDPSTELHACDTPGLCDTKIDALTMERELTRVILGCHEGLHAVLIVASCGGRMTSEEVQAIRFCFTYLFPRVVSHAMLVFTHADLLKNRPGESKTPVELQQQHIRRWRLDRHGSEILSMIQDRVLFLDNSLSGSAAVAQRVSVFRYIRTHFPTPYTTAIFDEAQTILTNTRRAAKEAADAPRRKLEAAEKDVVQLQAKLREVLIMAQQQPKVIYSTPLPMMMGGGGGNEDNGEGLFNMMFSAMCTVAVGKCSIM